MSEFGLEVVTAARMYVGKPFRHHFEPNLCDGGAVTLDSCMERGMDDEGYDCSGLIVASMCDVLGIAKPDWPRAFRHAKQMASLASDSKAEVGDILLFDTLSNARRGSIHIGIHSARHQVVHASGLRGIVEQTEVAGAIRAIRVVPATALAGLGFNKQI